METKKVAAGGCTLFVGAGVLAAGAVALALLAVAVAIPTVVLPWAAGRAEKELRAALDADVSLGGVEVSWFSTFPNLGVRVADLRITNRAPFEGVTLARAGEVTLSVDLISLLGQGPIVVESLSLSDAAFDVRVAADGTSNADLAGGSDGGEAEGGATPSLDLQDLHLEAVDFRYEDAGAGTLVDLRGLTHRSAGVVTGSVVDFDTETTIEALTAAAAGTTWLRDAAIDADVKVALDRETGAITFGDNAVAVNALRLAFAGRLAPQGEDLDLDVRFSTDQTEFGSLLSLVPGAFVADYEGVTVAGAFTLSGSAKGRYAREGDHLPGFDLRATVEGGRFQFPGLPGSVEDIALDVGVVHPEGPADLVEVDLERAHLAVGGGAFDGRLLLTHPMTDPRVDTAFRGTLDLGALSRAFPMEGSGLAGTLTADLSVAGAMSDFREQRLDAVAASGTVQAAGLVYTSTSLPTPITVEALDLSLSPAKVELREGRIRYAESDLAGSGELENAIPYLLADGVLRGRLAARSTHLDLRPFQGDEHADAAQPAPAEESEDVLVPVPTNLDLLVDADFGKVLMDDMVFERVDGAIRVVGGTVHLERLTAAMLGGEVTMSGTYAAPTADQADIDFDVTGIRFDTGAALDTFSVLERIAPVARTAVGRFDTGFKVKTRLGRDGTPDFQLLDSEGSFTTREVKMEPASLNGVATALKDDSYDSLDLDGTRFGYRLQGSRLALAPFEARLGGRPVRGRGDVDVEARTLDLALITSVPTAGLRGSELLGSFGDAVPAEVEVAITLTGPYDGPKLGVEIKGGQKLAGAVQRKVKEEVQAVAGDALAKAREVADGLLAEAAKVADTLRAEARKAADLVREQSEARARDIEKNAKGNKVKQAAAKAAADAVREEGAKQAGKIEKEADRAAEKALGEAKKRADEVLEAARTETDKATD